MANKYLIHGATFCGDGTASNEAASAGAPGAWNDIAVFTGTAPAYGTLAAGDNVYIRSKSSAGADISILVSSNINIGSANATASAPITWYIDGGSVWTGIQGQIKLYRTTGYIATIRANNNIVAEQQGRFLVSEEYSSTSTAWFYHSGSGYIDNVQWDYTAVTFGSTGPVVFSTSNGTNVVVLRNPLIKIGNKKNASIGLFYSSDYSYLLIQNPSIELTVPHASPIFGLGLYGARMRVEGGRVFGAGATGTTSLVAGVTTPSGLEIFGTDIPKVIPIFSSDLNSGTTDLRIELIGVDGGSMGAQRYTRSGNNSSRSDMNPPYLNATYPGGGGWSWNVYPYGATFARPHEVVMHAAYTGAAAAKTITVEFLVSNTFNTLLNKGNVWLDVMYWDDATGTTAWVSTRNKGSVAALDTSNAAWLPALSWGSVNLVRYKIAVTTPTAIKQNSLVTVIFRIDKASVTSNDILFVDPDPQLT